MKIVHIGNSYSGWNICLNLVPQNSVILSGGIGNDISLELELIKRKNCKIIAVDPTLLSEKCIKNLNNKNITFIKKALLTHNNGIEITAGDTNGASIYDSKRKVKVESIDIRKLLAGISLLKLNIEGAEYQIILELDDIRVPQICIRFHHRKEQVPFTKEDTKKCIKKIEGFGYRSYGITDIMAKKADYEVLFIRCLGAPRIEDKF